MARKAIVSCEWRRVDEVAAKVIDDIKLGIEEREEKWRTYFHEFSELHNDDGTRPTREECREYADEMMGIKHTP